MSGNESLDCESLAQMDGEASAGQRKAVKSSSNWSEVLDHMAHLNNLINPCQEVQNFAIGNAFFKWHRVWGCACQVSEWLGIAS